MSAVAATAVVTPQQVIMAQIATLMKDYKPKTAADFEAGANPFTAGMGDEPRIAGIWLREALAKGPTPRVLAMPDQARVRSLSFGWLIGATITDPAWGSDDPAGRERFVAAVRAAYALAVDHAKAIHWHGSMAMFELIAAIPPSCYDVLPVGEEEATAAVVISPYDRPIPFLMSRLVDRIRPAALRLLAEAYPAEPWSMRAFARMAKLA